MGVTIKDIAQIAGVSYSTVSKALNNSPLVNESTKATVIKIAQQLGYHPNIAAQTLVSKKNNIIGISWPNIQRLARTTLMEKINSQITRHSYNSLISIDPLDSAVTMFNRLQVDAIIIVVERDKDTDIISRNHISSGVPILYYGKSDPPRRPTVDVNRRKAMFQAFQFLYQLGHRRIAYIGDLSHNIMMQKEKFLGYTDGIVHYGLKLDQNIVFSTENMTWQEGYKASKQLLNIPDRPTAVISASFELTNSLITAINENSLKIPRDISVLSYDNMPEYTPKMSTLEIPVTSIGAKLDRIAEKIAEVLMALLKDPASLPTSTEIEYELVVRESCAPPPR